MAKPTLRSWLWLGAASIALTGGLHTSANAQLILGNNAPVHVTNIDDIQLPQQFTFSQFSGSRLLMPNPNLKNVPRLYLKDPSSDEKIQLVKPGEKPAGGYKLIIPEDAQRVSLTPPPGVKVYLTPPRPQAAPKKVVKKVAKKAAPKPEPKPEKIVEAPVVAKAPAPTPAPTPSPMAKPDTAVVNVAKEAATQVAETDKVKSPTESVEAKVAPTVQEVETKAVETVAKIEEKTAETVAQLETPTAPPAPTQVAAVPTPPAIEAPQPIAPPVAPKVEVTKVEAPQIAAAPTPKAKPATPAPAAPDMTTVALVFGPDDARLNDDHRALIKGVVSQLEADPNSAIQLMAYAVANDRSKSRRLSLSRALAVRSYLLKHEVRNTRIQVRAMGDQVKSGKPDRVDMILVKP